MTTAAMPPDLPAVIQALRDRVDSLERTQPQGTTPSYDTGLTWTAPSDLPIRGSKDLRIESVWADTPAPVGSDTTWDLQRNGVTVGTVTVAAGDSHGHVNLDPVVVADIFDVFTVAGTATATVRALGRSSSPDSPAVGGSGGGGSCSGFAHVNENLGGTSLAVDASFNTVADLTFTDPTVEVCGAVASIVGGKLEVATAGWYFVGGQLYVDSPAGYTRLSVAGPAYSPGGVGYVADMRYWGDTGPGATQPVNIGAQLVYLAAGEQLFWQGVTSSAGSIYSTTLWIHQAGCGCAAPGGGGGGGGGG